MMLVALGFALPARAGDGGNAVCESRTFEGARFTVCRVDSRQQDIELRWKGRDGKALRTFPKLANDLGMDARRLRFAMNAGMFEDNGMPVGLYVERGRTLRPLNTRDADGNFYLKPNGVFVVDGDDHVAVETAEAFGRGDKSVTFATQSGPMLVIDGKLHPKISDDGPSKNIRNGVGVSDNHTAWFVISDEPVSFGRLARLFRDALDCPNALYFDGAISNLWVPSQGRRASGPDLGPLVVVLDKPLN